MKRRAWASGKGNVELYRRVIPYPSLGSQIAVSSGRCPRGLCNCSLAAAWTRVWCIYGASAVTPVHARAPMSWDSIAIDSVYIHLSSIAYTCAFGVWRGSIGLGITLIQYQIMCSCIHIRILHRWAKSTVDTQKSTCNLEIVISTKNYTIFDNSMSTRFFISWSLNDFEDIKFIKFFGKKAILEIKYNITKFTYKWYTLKPLFVQGIGTA